MVQSHLRFAVGVCVLAAGLLMGGGAVAVADPDSSGSAAHPNSGTNASGQGSTTASNPVGTVTDTVQNTVQDMTSSVGAGRPPGQQPSSVTSTVGPGRQPSSATSTVGPGRQPSSATSTVGSGRQPGQQPSTGAKSPKKEPGGTGSVLVAAVPDLVAAVPNVVTPVPRAVTQVPKVVAPVIDVVTPATDVVAKVPNLVAAGSDVIASVQDRSTSVAAGAVVPPTQSQSDLSSFLLSIAGVEPAVDGLGGIHGAGLSAAADASVASQLPLVLPSAGVAGMPLAGNATGVPTLGGIPLSTFCATSQVGRALSLPGMAPLTANGAIPMGVRSFLRHALHDLPLAASLAALAAVALPGAAGLVILTLAGVRVGYRQAKAGFVVRTAGIADFARPGPLGVVRPGPLSAGYVLEKVA